MQTDPQPSTTSRRPLQYGPPIAWLHRKSVRDRLRLALAVLIAAAVVFAAWQIFQRAALLHDQRDCMSYVLPPEKVVFETDPAATRLLLNSDPQYIAMPAPSVVWFARCWDRFATAANPPGERPSATLFLHQRTAPDGTSRLVVIELRPPISALAGPTLEAELYEPGNWLAAPKILAGLSRARIRGDDFWARPTANQPPLRFFAGQPDPTDSSHFTIPFQYAGHRFKIDGWLVSSDEVELDWENSPMPTLVH